MSSYIDKARSLEQKLLFFPFNGETAQVSAPAVLSKMGGKVVCSVSLQYNKTPKLSDVEKFRKEMQAFLSTAGWKLSETYLLEIVLPSTVITKFQITVDLN